LARYHVGIDVGKNRHHACVRDTVEKSYTGVISFTVDRHGFERLLTWLQCQGPADDVLLGVEASGPYALTIEHFLLEHGYSVAEVNPFHASQFRQAQGKKAKTDRVDARSLAAFLELGSYKLLQKRDSLWENLRELTRFRADLVKDRSCQVNRLKETLAVAFPELERHLSSLDSTTALTLLAAYPGPQHLAAAGTEVVSAALAEFSHHRLGPARAASIVGAASATVGLLQRQQALALKLEMLSQGILAINAQIKRVEETIEELFRQLPYPPSSFPVGRIQSLAGILAEIDDIRRFPTLKHFLSHFGWCPQTFQTGGFRQEHPRMSHAGNRYVRRLVWMLAITASKTVPVYHDYFMKRTAAGKKKMHTIVAIGRKLLSVIYAILKSRKPYVHQGGASQTSLCPALTSI